jgi:hypothetical protein
MKSIMRKVMLLVSALAVVMVMAAPAFGGTTSPNASAQGTGVSNYPGHGQSLGPEVKSQAQHNNTDLGGRVSEQPNHGRTQQTPGPVGGLTRPPGAPCQGSPLGICIPRTTFPAAQLCPFFGLV